MKGHEMQSQSFWIYLNLSLAFLWHRKKNIHTRIREKYLTFYKNKIDRSFFTNL
jgi:hypothetical protein